LKVVRLTSAVNKFFSFQFDIWIMVTISWMKFQLHTFSFHFSFHSFIFRLQCSHFFNTFHFSFLSVYLFFIFHLVFALFHFISPSILSFSIYSVCTFSFHFSFHSFIFHLQCLHFFISSLFPFFHFPFRVHTF
jgi:hypothetical protein